MSGFLLLTLLIGMTAGWLSHGMLAMPSWAESAVFSLMLLAIGIQLGSDRQLGTRLRRSGIRILLFPINTVVGSALGALLAAWIIHARIGVTMAIGAGYGWYSLAALILNELDGARVAAIAFLANLLREILCFWLVPAIVRIRNGSVALSMGGATTMDTTLPLFTRAQSTETVVYAFVNGAVLSMLVPLAVPLLYRL